MNVRGTKIQRNVVWSRKFVFITNHGNSRKEMTLILLNVWLSYPILDYLECKSNFKGRGSRSDRCNNVKSSFKKLFPIAKINHYHGHERVYEIAGVQQSVKIWKKKWSRLTRALNSVTFSPEVRCKGNDRAYTPTASGDKRVGNQPKPAKAIRRQPKRKLCFGFLPIPPVAQPFFPTSDIYISSCTAIHSSHCSIHTPARRRSHVSDTRFSLAKRDWNARKVAWNNPFLILLFFDRGSFRAFHKDSQTRFV